jgi:hypothetical protein
MQSQHYATWREDKDPVPGFSRELISSDYYDFIQDQTSLDELYVLPFPGVDTILKALKRNLDIYPY